MQALIDGAPRLLDRLGDASRAHFDGAAAAARPTPASRSRINPRLVRGLDYYNRTVFEWMTDRLGAQGTVGGGGRYDGLFEQLGGKPTPACGFAIGIERVTPAAAGLAGRVVRRGSADAYVVHVGEARGDARAVRSPRRCATQDSRSSSTPAAASFKSQMKRADASGARYALIVGDDEAAANRVARQAAARDGRTGRRWLPAQLAARIRHAANDTH